MRRVVLVALCLALGACAGSDGDEPDFAGSPGPTGSGEVVVEGHEGDVDWQLLRADGEDGETCLQVRTTPALDGEVVRIGDDGLGTITPVDGSQVAAGETVGPSCAVPSSDPFGIRLLAVGGREASVHYMAGLVGGEESVVTFSDGSREVIEPTAGVFALVWSGDRWPTLIDSPHATCQLNGDATLSGGDDVCG